MLSMEVSQLIEQCRQGSADALGELYNTYAQRMRGVCRRYISDEQTISDVLHDAFVIIFTSFDKLHDDRKAEAWMMSITRNVASKYKEHLTRMPFVPLEEAEHLPIPEDEDDVKGIPLKEVLKFVERLPEGYRQIFRLSVFEGMSHKEIADMLGIEPHSSSSQLSRAKKMLRKMMQQYWLAMLLLLLLPLTLFFFRRGDTAVKYEKPSVTRHKEIKNELPKRSPTDRLQNPLTIHLPVRSTTAMTTDTLHLNIAKATDFITDDSLSNKVAQEQANCNTISNDTTEAIRKVELPHYDIAELCPGKKGVDTGHQKKWSALFAYAGGLGEQYYNRPYGFTEMPIIAPVGEPLSPVTFKNWSDYAAYLSELPDDGSSHSRSVIMNIALNNSGDATGSGTDKIVRKSHHYMPINFSLALRYKFNNRFGLEAGLSYSRLKSEFEMGSNGNTINEKQTIHYIGIPVKGTYNMYTGRLWALYGNLGVTTEIPVYSPLNTNYYLHGILKASEKARVHAPWQWSFGVGLGLQYNLTPRLGFFAEPSLQYYIPTGSSIETYRTEHPFMFTLPLGIRFTW